MPLPLLSASARRIGSALDAATTAALLRDVPAAFDAPITGVLLAALGHSFSAAGRTTALLVDLERHGRSERFDGVDVTRTVGWFTSIHPVSRRPRRRRQPVKPSWRGRATRSAPCQATVSGTVCCGISARRPSGRRSPPAEIPRSASTISVSSISSRATGRSLRSRRSRPAPRKSRTHPTPTCDRCGGVRCRRDRCAPSGRSIPAVTRLRRSERLCAGFIDALQTVGASARAYATVTRSADSNGSYPLTPMQHGMLFHTLLHPDDGVYSEVFTCRFEGRRRRRRSSARPGRSSHSVTTCCAACSSGKACPIRFRSSPIDRRGLDAARLVGRGRRRRSGCGCSALVERESRHRSTWPRDRSHGRRWCGLTRVDAQLVWSFHHILLDGWSMAVVFREAAGVYDALLEARAPELPAPMPVRPLRPLAPTTAARGRDGLSGARRSRERSLPTPLGIAAPEGASRPGRSIRATASCV